VTTLEDAAQGGLFFLIIFGKDQMQPLASALALEFWDLDTTSRPRQLYVYIFICSRRNTTAVGKVVDKYFG